MRMYLNSWKAFFYLSVPVVIQSEGGVALDFDSVLFDKVRVIVFDSFHAYIRSRAFKDRNSIGVVFDLFGPVRSPLYSVRFNTKEEVSVFSCCFLKVAVLDIFCLRISAIKADQVYMCFLFIENLTVIG